MKTQFGSCAQVELCIGDPYDHTGDETFGTITRPKINWIAVGPVGLVNARQVLKAFQLAIRKAEKLKRQAEKLNNKKYKPAKAHCSKCHETFPNSQVRILKNGADICPKCKVENFTCVLDGEYTCSCGEK